jgi:hypothetical protein
MTGMDLEAIRLAVSGLHRGRRWIIAADAAAAAHDMVERLREDEPAGVMIVAGIEGVGELPDADRFHYTRASGDTLMDGIRSFLASVEHPSADLLAAVDAFDPEGSARVLGQGFSREQRLAGRTVYGRRRLAWRQLEDKSTVDALWDDAGVTRAPSAVVPVTGARHAAANLGTSVGTVWVADNRTGWHGGGEYTRWVPPDIDPEEVEAWFATRADQVRVMPFLDGIPCSIHGFVTHDGVAVFLPLELFILRTLRPPGFVYAQGANFWTPPRTMSDDMRAAARSVGAMLADRLGYVGAFGIDGVATVDGFRPTELNPRLTLGHMIQGRTADVPLGPMERMMLEDDLTVAARDLEDHIIDSVTDRRGGGMMFTTTRVAEPAEAWFRFTDDGVAATSDPDGAVGRMALGPATFGSLVQVTLDPEGIPVGPSLAPRAAQLMAMANDLWGLELPTVYPPPDLTAQSSKLKAQSSKLKAQGLSAISTKRRS